MQFDFPALGTHWWLEIWDAVSPQKFQAIRSHVLKVVTCFEAKYSRFAPNSVISQLNRQRTLALDDESLKLLRYGVALFQRSGGIFNILVGHILEARGYDHKYSLTDSGSQALTAGNPNQDIVFDGNRVHLKYGNVDIGGYGKGWLIDTLYTHLQNLGIYQLLINGGGDIYVTHQQNQPVDIYLEDPFNSEKIVGTIQLKNAAFAASSPHKRAWPIKQRINNQEQISSQNHIVSHHAVKDVVYLTAASAVDADAFATTLLQTDNHTTQKLLVANKLTLITPT